MSDPSQFFDTLESVLSCVCQTMDDLAATDETYEGCPCVQFVSPGEPVIDCCTECDTADGRVSVHLENIYLSDVFPEAAGTYEPCKAATWVASIVVTVARCISQEGDAPTVEALEAAARTQALDAYAIMTALGCCLVSDAPPGKRKRRVQVVGSNPLPEEGACAGLEVRANVETGVLCNCQDGS